MILPLEKQVCSLNLAKRLKELGVKQESLFVYTENTLRPIILRTSVLREYRNDCLSAFTVAELGELLPKGSYSLKVEYNDGWYWNVNSPKVNFINGFKDKITEADARAIMLINLIKGNMMEVPK